MLLRLVCGDEGVLRADQPGPLLLGVEGVGLLGAHQPGPLGGQPCLLRGAPAAVHDDLSDVSTDVQETVSRFTSPGYLLC